MSDHIIRKWRRDCWQEMSAGGMRVGMPHISVLCTDALRMCLEIEHLRAELAERDAEIARLRDGLVRIIDAWDGDSESMHDDPAVIARAAIAGECK